MKIRFIPNNEIDEVKWNQCIEQSVGGIVYAYSWYLDITAVDWDALIADDYVAVFPLVKGKRLGVDYLYQPHFSQQLGIFSKVLLNDQLIKNFLDAIPSRYRYILINFNTFNRIDVPGIRTIDKATYQLDLIQPYYQLSRNYNENTRRNVLKSLAMGVKIVKGLSIDELINFKKSNQKVMLKSRQVDTLRRIVTHTIEKGLGEIYAAYSARNELCAASFFIRPDKKVIYLLAASNTTGLEVRAMFALVDQFIRDHSETELILDFEGSTIESVARFYSGFGAVRCTYQQLVVNRLPWLLKLIFV